MNLSLNIFLSLSSFDSLICFKISFNFFLLFNLFFANNCLTLFCKSCKLWSYKGLSLFHFSKAKRNNNLLLLLSISFNKFLNFSLVSSFVLNKSFNSLYCSGSVIVFIRFFLYKFNNIFLNLFWLYFLFRWFLSKILRQNFWIILAFKFSVRIVAILFQNRRGNLSWYLSNLILLLTIRFNSSFLLFKFLSFSMSYFFLSHLVIIFIFFILCSLTLFFQIFKYFDNK